MNRESMIEAISAPEPEWWDVLIIGGGASGLGAALDAVSRGYRTLLLEASDFAKGTSSRSTKIIHGGVRYLRQGNIRLVKDSLRERGVLMRNCPELVIERGFVVPHYRWSERFFYGIGLKVYDWLAGDLGLSKSRRLSKGEIRESFPTLNSRKLRGGTLYFDGQFDDARLAIALARSINENGGTLANYVRVESLLKENSMVTGVVACDLENDVELNIRSRVVINATGVFADSIRRMDEEDCGTLVAPSQGIHLVLDSSFLPSENALMIPKTDDGRLLFAIPWNGTIVAGTTDTPRKHADEEPVPLEEEIDYLLDHLGRYLDPAPTRSDVLSTFAGLRPLVRPSGNAGASSKISRDHTISISPSGLITIVGGKWTTYRHMGEDVINRAAKAAGLAPKPSRTKDLAIPGRHLPTSAEETALHPELEITHAHVVAAVEHEMARTLDDVLARRTRCLLLNARASLEVAPRVAEIMARVLDRDADWMADQLGAFEKLASRYLPKSASASSTGA